MKSLTLTIASQFLIGTAVAAGTSSAQFLKMGAGARAAAMGDSYSSISDDTTAAYWNVAGLAQVKDPEISVMANSGLVDTQYQFAGAALPIRDSVLGISLYRLDFGSIDRYSPTNTKDGTFTAGSLAGALSYARSLNENLSWGVTAKYIQETIESEQGTSFAGDAGVLYHRGSWKFGGAVQHLGPGIKMVQESAPLPLTVRLGASTQINDNLLVALDVSKPNDNKLSLHSGVEYALVPHVALRAGYSVTPGNRLDVSGLTGVTGGLGVKFGSFGLDYAFVPFGDLGITHRVSLQYRFHQAN